MNAIHFYFVLRKVRLYCKDKDTFVQVTKLSGIEYIFR